MEFLKNKAGSITIDKVHQWNDDAPKGIIVKNTTGKRIDSILMNENGTSISCGVGQVYGLPTNSRMKSVIGIIKGSAKTELEAKELIASLFKKVLRPVPSRFILFSDNDVSSRSVIHEILSDICDYETKWARNPNSGNKIKVWTYIKRR